MTSAATEITLGLSCRSSRRKGVPMLSIPARKRASKGEKAATSRMKWSAAVQVSGVLVTFGLAVAAPAVGVALTAAFTLTLILLGRGK